ncbi:MAG: hypothetical protein ACYDHG_18220 [Desulfomonilaceae bacterium]
MERLGLGPDDLLKKYPQIIESDMIVAIGNRQFPGNPIKFSGFDSSCADAPPPALGADNDKIRDYFKQ